MKKHKHQTILSIGKRKDEKVEQVVLRQRVIYTIDVGDQSASVTLSDSNNFNLSLMQLDITSGKPLYMQVKGIRIWVDKRKIEYISKRGRLKYKKLK